MRYFLKIIASICVVVGTTLAWTAPDSRTLYLVDLDGAVGPASVDLVIRVIEKAEETSAQAVILRLNTPGGLDRAMRDLVQTILASRVPIITYVAPNGARAASAGTYISYASHIAAMAPATNIGSSTPVSIAPQGLPTAPAPVPAQDEDDSAGTSPTSAMENKVINDAVAYLQSLAELRGRNIQWAEETVRKGANLRASEALAINVIDLIATDLDELLAALDGRSVNTAGGEYILNTSSATIEIQESDWRHDLLEIITDPSVAYGLLIIGLYALLLEFYNPGLMIPAITGIIFILLGAYGLQLLPVNYTGVALVLLGIALMIAEVITPTVGILGVGGLIAFVLGSMIMFDSEVPGYELPLSIIAGFATATALTVFFVVGMAVRARNQKVVTGVTAMIGTAGVVTHEFIAHDDHFSGEVRTHGELWQARSKTPLQVGENITIDAIDGLTLDVSKES
jgi:membrane-bound serine protease (ClpP class)